MAVFFFFPIKLVFPVLLYRCPIQSWAILCSHSVTRVVLGIALLLSPATVSCRQEHWFHLPQSATTYWDKHQAHSIDSCSVPASSVCTHCAPHAGWPALVQNYCDFTATTVTVGPSSSSPVVILYKRLDSHFYLWIALYRQLFAHWLDCNPMWISSRSSVPLYRQTVMYKSMKFSSTHRVYMARPCGAAIEALVLNWPDLSHCCPVAVPCCHLSCTCHLHRRFFTRPLLGPESCAHSPHSVVDFVCVHICVWQCDVQAQKVCVWGISDSSVFGEAGRCTCNRSATAPLFCDWRLAGSSLSYANVVRATMMLLRKNEISREKNNECIICKYLQSCYHLSSVSFLPVCCNNLLDEP